MDNLDALKERAARAALEYVKDGYVVGLGTGSTARHMVLMLGERVKAGLTIKGVPTSAETATLAKHAGIPLIDTEDRWEIDVAIDGADQVDPNFNLMKGGGGALLKEKIVAASARQFIVMVDHTKQVSVLGGSVPLPIEVVPFGWGSTAREIETLTKSRVVLRERNGVAFKTESENLILDAHIDRIEWPDELETALCLIPGVVEAGLFVGRTSVLIVATPQGVQTLHAPGR